MRPNDIAYAAVLACALAATSCSKPAESAAPETAAGAAAPGEPASTEPGAPDVPFDEKTLAQKKEFMGLVVLPKMKDLFQKHDPEEFADVKCQTCHGANMEEVSFEMPNTLHPLPVEGTLEHAMEEDSDTAKFMMETVVPTMAELLGEAPFDPNTGQGFGCFNCHAKE